MTTKEVITVVNAGILNATGHSLPASEFYKFFSFRRALRRIYDKFASEEAALIKEVGISQDEIQQIGGRVAISPKRKDGSTDEERLAKYKLASDQLLAKKVKLEGYKKIPLRHFKDLYDENRRKVDGRDVDIFASTIVEDFVLENLFERI